MIYVAFFAVCFLASVVGAICGIGGGVIIKPVLDSFGVLGKELFSLVKAASSDLNHVGAVQAICLLIVTMGTLIYTIYKEKIKTYQVKNSAICILIGIFPREFYY